MSTNSHTNPDFVNNLFEENGFIVEQRPYQFTNDSFKYCFSKVINNGKILIFRNPIGNMRIHVDTAFTKTYASDVNIERMITTESIKYIEEKTSHFVNVSFRIFSFFANKGSSQAFYNSYCQGTEYTPKYLINRRKFIIFASKEGIIIHTHGEIYYVDTGFSLPWKLVESNRCEYIDEEEENINIKKRNAFNAYDGVIYSNNIKTPLLVSIKDWKDIDPSSIEESLKSIIFG